MASLFTSSTLVPFVFGCAIGWAANWHFYRRARRDAERSHAMVLMHLRTVLEAAEKSGAVELVRDADGRPTGGRVVRAVPNAGALGLAGQAPIVALRADSSTVVGVGTVTKGAADPKE
jgi:hypothetical protein